MAKSAAVSSPRCPASGLHTALGEAAAPAPPDSARRDTVQHRTGAAGAGDALFSENDWRRASQGHRRRLHYVLHLPKALVPGGEKREHLAASAQRRLFGR